MHVPRSRLRHPLLYEVNARVWLRNLTHEGKQAETLRDVPDSTLDKWKALGFNYIWLMGAWQTGPAGRTIARSHPDLQASYRAALDDYTEEDIIGSPYAVQEYTVSADLGGPEALADLRQRLADRGIGLILDFVGNHTSTDCPWLQSNPEFYVQGTEEELAAQPNDFFSAGKYIAQPVIAHGRDPYFPPWTDTAQLNYRHPGCREKMLEVLMSIAGQCDGVRCDMAMLLFDDIIEMTWGERSRASLVKPVFDSFWNEALPQIKEAHPDFVFIGEVYWDREWDLQQAGFDFTYDKRLYERLLYASANDVHSHLTADHGYQEKCVRFLENHDEKRLASLVDRDRAIAASVIAATAPGMAFFHEGQLQGFKRFMPVQLGRRQSEETDETVLAHYEKLLTTLQLPAITEGTWELLDPQPVAQGESGYEQFVAHVWAREGDAIVVVVNFSRAPGRCHLPIYPLTTHGIDLEHRSVEFEDVYHGRTFTHQGDDMLKNGLYIELPAWGFHALEVKNC